MKNKFFDAMQYRHATKVFDVDKKISDEEFNSILKIGQISPSSFGFEPWKFLVIQNKELREKLKDFSWGAIEKLDTSSHFMIILARKKQSMLYSSEYIQHMLKDVKQLPDDVITMYNGFYEQFQKKDFDLLHDDRHMFDWASKQTYIALANMMTGAAYMGIDSCPIEGFDYLQTEQFLKNELGVDTDEFGPSVMLSFGYRVDQPREKIRQELSDLVSWYK